MSSLAQLAGAVFSGARSDVGPLSLEIRAGDTIAVIGKSGSGKTLLLRGLAGLAPLREGSARVVMRKDTSGRHHPDVGLAFQRGALLAEQSVLQNVALAAIARGLDSPQDRAAEALCAVGLQDAADLLPAALSGGMRHRVGLARALCASAPLILCDDVTAGLDPCTATEVVAALLRACERSGRALVVTSHDVDTVLRFIPRVLLLDKGAVAFSGDAPGLRQTAYQAFAPVTTTAAGSAP